MDKIAGQCIHVFRMFPKRICQGCPAFDIGFDIVDEVTEVGIVRTLCHNFEGLNQRDTRWHHRGKLAGENRDILGDYLPPFRTTATKQRLGLLFDLERIDTLLAQVRLNESHVLARRFPLLPVSLFVSSFPDKNILFYCFFGHIDD